MRPVNEPKELKPEAHLIASEVGMEIGVSALWTLAEIAKQADQELEKFPEDVDGIRAGMTGSWREYIRCDAAGKLVRSACGPEKFYGEGRWRDPKRWGLKPGMRAYDKSSAA